MAKGVVKPDLEFVQGWCKGCKAEMTLKEIADSLGMEYNACAARAKSLAKRFQGMDKYQPKPGKRGRKTSEADKAAIEALLAEFSE